jgi:hypothetical protein
MNRLLFQDFGRIDNQRNEILNSLRMLFDSKEFVKLAALFGVHLDINKDVESILKDVNENLIDKWDFRKRTKMKESKSSNVGARWGINDVKLTKEQEDLAFYVAEKFGITSAVFPLQKKYNYGIVLGGAKLSNYLRFKYINYLEKYEGLEFDQIILLGSTRPLSSVEKKLIKSTLEIEVYDEYGFFKELARMNYGDEEVIHQYKSPDLYGSSEVVKFGSKEQTPCIAVKAPSTEPKKRRAHTGDTYKFLFENGYIEMNKSVCASTSSIYIPYQQLAAYKFHALQYNLEVETVGFPPDWRRSKQQFTGAQHYLQEIKSFFSVVYGLVIPH